MTYYTLNIDNYYVYYYSSGPQINLESAGKTVGKLIFKPNGEILPPTSTSTVVSPPGLLFTLYYHLDDFQNVIDILRNEKPVSLLCVHITIAPAPGTGQPASYIDSASGIGTGPEPVGEGE